MKIIIVTQTATKGGYQARVFGKTPAVQVFSKTEVGALASLADKLMLRNPKFIR